MEIGSLVTSARSDGVRQRTARHAVERIVVEGALDDRAVEQLVVFPAESRRTYAGTEPQTAPPDATPGRRKEHHSGTSPATELVLVLVLAVAVGGRRSWRGVCAVEQRTARQRTLKHAVERIVVESAP